MSPTARMGGIDLSAVQSQPHVLRAAQATSDRMRRRSKTILMPSKANVTMPLAILDHASRENPMDGLWRVRLVRKITDASQGEYMGKPLRRLHEEYLDGTTYDRTYGGGQVTKDDWNVEDPVAIVQAQTKDIIDLGRFEQACIALVQVVDKAGDEPDDDQQEAILRSYQGLIAWREDVNERLLKIDGALDVAAAKVRQAMK